jgi:CRP-like cAMP-binding protein
MVWEENHGAPKWGDIMEDLPSSLRTAIKLELCHRAIIGMRIFEGMSQADKLELINNLTPFTATPGEVLMLENAQVVDLMIFCSGTIETMVGADDTAVVVQVINQVKYEGEMEFLFKKPRRSTLRAVTFVDGWRLNRVDFSRMVKGNPRLQRLIIGNARTSFAKEFRRLRPTAEFFFEEPKPDEEGQEVFPPGEFMDVERF